MNDLFSLYQQGIAKLLQRLGTTHPNYTEALTLQVRLQENLAAAHRYGHTETRTSERAQILDALNQLALATTGLTFNHISGISQDAHPTSTLSSSTGSRAKERKLLSEREPSWTKNTTQLSGPVQGPVHTGSGDIYMSGTKPAEDK